jgi:hypothetical protein
MKVLPICIAASIQFLVSFNIPPLLSGFSLLLEKDMDYDIIIFEYLVWSP